ncbi:MAG: hypothetical protein AABY05_02630 [Nanoarchaeota archaeon]
MEEKIAFLVLSSVLFLSLIGFVDSFAVGSSYWPENSLNMAPGETKIIDMRLQNIVGSEDENVRVVLEKGKEIAKVDEKDYFIPLGTSDAKVSIQISIPEDITVGTKYPVTLSFTGVNSNSGEGVSLGVSYNVDFDVLIVPKIPNQYEANSNLLWLVVALVLAVLVILVVILIILAKKKNKKIV